MINTNLHSISHRLQVIGQICAFDMGEYLCEHTFVVNPLTQDHEIWPQETRDIALSYGMDVLTDDYFVLSQCNASDRRTDGQNCESKSAL